MPRLLTLEPGTLLGDKYRIEEVLGAGGMGAVYSAQHTAIGRRVAIKVLNPELAREDTIVQRFRMEARAAGLIRHPGIVDVLDTGTDGAGAPYIVMEFLEGETLDDRIKRAGPLPIAQAVQILEQVLDALAAAHEAGIVHRDLKPANIFLCERPQRLAKILDFGISKFQSGADSSLTRTGDSMGTPLYMAPEQMRGARDVGPTADLWSVGAILYKALVGWPPFGGATQAEVIAKVLTEEHQPVRLLRPDAPPALSALVDALLAKSPSDRPQEARLTREVLHRSLGPDGGDTDPLAPALSARDTARDAQTALSVAIARTEAAPSTASARPKPVAQVAPATERRRRHLRPLGLAGLGVAIGTVVIVGLRLSRPGPAPSAPAPVTTAPTDAGAAPAPPRAIELRLIADPASATWQIDGQPLSCNPCVLSRPAGSRHQAEARAAGHVARRLEVLFDRPREERLTLAPEVGGADAGERGSHRPPRKPGQPGRGERDLTIDRTNPFR